MRHPVVQVGDVVRLVFQDHTEGGDDPHTYEVFGRVKRKTRASYTLDAWGLLDDKDRASMMEAGNVNSFCILRRTIQFVHILERPDDPTPWRPSTT